MIIVPKRFFKSFNFSQYFRFFLWNLLLSFGMICVAGSLLADEKVTYSARGKRDPFVPLVTLTMKSSSSSLLGIDNIEDLTVEGVVYDPQHGSVAIVNGVILKEGDELGGVKVLKVGSKGVRFLINGVEGFKEIYQDEPADKKNVAKV